MGSNLMKKFKPSLCLFYIFLSNFALKLAAPFLEYFLEYARYTLNGFYNEGGHQIVFFTLDHFHPYDVLSWSSWCVARRLLDTPVIASFIC
jgi:hypothetical protein